MKTLLENKSSNLDFLQVGNTNVSYSANHIIFNNNFGDYNVDNYIYYPEFYTTLKNIYYSFDYKKIDVNNSSLFIGFKSINTWNNLTTGLHIVNIGNVTQFYIKTLGVFITDTFVMSILLNLNETISIGCNFNETTITIEIKQNGLSIISLPITSSYNTGVFAIQSTNGSNDVSNISISTNYTDYYDIVMYGDSTFARPISVARELAKILKVAIMAGSGDRTTELKKVIFTDGSIKRKINICGIGSNDPASGITYSESLSNIQEIDSKLQFLAPSFWLTVMPRNGIDVKPINNIIRSVVPQNRLIEYNRLFWNGSNGEQINPTYSSDNIHLNSVGSLIASNYIYNYLISNNLI